MKKDRPTKKQVLDSGIFRIFVSIFAVALYFILLLSIDTVAVSNSQRKVPIYSVERSDKVIALTFDAAWGADKTQEIMDTLKKYEVKATFFLVGFWVEKYPELTKQIYDNGFEIGTHSQTHPNMTQLSEEKIKEELTKSIGLIENITKTPVKVFRPPFGDYNNKLIEICDNLKLHTIQWDVDTLDWKGITPEQIVLRVEEKIRNGSIILCHNNSKYIVEALPPLITMLRAKGYQFETVSNLIYSSNFTIDHTGRQHSTNS